MADRIVKEKGITGEFLLDILIRNKVIDKKDIEKIHQRQLEKGSNIQSIIIGMGLIDKDKMMNMISEEISIPYVNLDGKTFDPSIVAMIPEDLSRQHGLVTIGKQKDKLVVAMANPLDVYTQDEIKIKLGYEIETRLAYSEDIARVLDMVYGITEDWQQMMGEIKSLAVTAVEETAEEMDISKSISQSHEAPVVALVNLIMLRAIKEGASDIHIEPYGEKSLKVRYRIDGVLHDIMSPPRNLHMAIISRVKIMSNMNIAERRLPQDGRIKVQVHGREVNFRVSTIPAVNGESAVLRILDPAQIMLDLKSIGFSKHNLKKYQELIEKPNGILLVTGPTGSGKSTTLYATLNILNSVEKKIMTIEDPVEYRLDGVNQLQARPKIGLTFAAGLRSFLRQDPDIMLVGEIRDKETADIAIQSALTGHLVLSTLHTNDAPSSIVRLIDMGIEPFLISSSVIGVIAQRLVRKICDYCKKEIPVTDEIKKVMEGLNINPDKMKVFHGEGCQHCKGTGYKGRTAIFELMVINENIREMIYRNASLNEIRQTAIEKNGMVTLREDGFRNIIKGITTVEEVVRTTSS
ncbi:MAG: GspE/PulE family protein [Atribacterota bacterium]|jgi:type IV pilus assembly protein PilB|nr:GspE/PulE family protein [Atribacterota bacterium]MDD3641768.1 GspE/PulE family protein [Atribacterota bacterium]MDD4289395.1 GspE/PulE family protein [Atribacterota bacterium]MDI9597552.1 GspE/PulE family protein [Atribacterota bacterium]